jgi:hypothetical protein
MNARMPNPMIFNDGRTERQRSAIVSRRINMRLLALIRIVQKLSLLARSAFGRNG